MVGSCRPVSVGAKHKVAVFGGYVGFNFKEDPLLFSDSTAELAEKRGIAEDLSRRNQLLNSDDRDTVLISKFQKLGQTQQLAVIADNLANDANRLEASHCEQCHCRLSVTGTLHKASRGCSERENVTRTDQVLSGGMRIGQYAKCARSVRGTDSCGHS
jgi:hypothetical protein